MSATFLKVTRWGIYLAIGFIFVACVYAIMVEQQEEGWPLLIGGMIVAAPLYLLARYCLRKERRQAAAGGDGFYFSFRNLVVLIGAIALTAGPFALGVGLMVEGFSSGNGKYVGGGFTILTIWIGLVGSVWRGAGDLMD